MQIKYLKASIRKVILLFATLLIIQKNFSQEPTITSISPSYVGAGDTLTIIGTNFIEPIHITLGGLPVDPWLTVVTTTKIKVQVSGYPPDGLVSVETDGGIALSPGLFHFESQPYITETSPYLIGEGDTVTIQGKYLFDGLNSTLVSFGNVPAASAEIISYKLIKAVVGKGVGALKIETTFGIANWSSFEYRKKINLCPFAPGPTLSASSTGSSYQWQLSTNGTNFTNISNDGNHSGVNTKYLALNNIPSSWYGYQYRCLIQNFIEGDEYILNFTNNWTGNTNTSWENINNWSCGKLPDSETDVIINSGDIILNTNATIRSLTISPNAHLTVASGVRLTITH